MKKEENKKKNVGVAAAAVAAATGAVLAGAASMNDEEVVDNTTSPDENFSDTDTEDIIEPQPLTEELTADELENVVAPETLSHTVDIETTQPANHENTHVTAGEHVAHNEHTATNEHNSADDNDIVEELHHETESESNTDHITEYQHEAPGVQNPQDDSNEWQDEIDEDEQMAVLTRESEPTFGEQVEEFVDGLIEKADNFIHGNSADDIPDVVSNADDSAW